MGFTRPAVQMGKRRLRGAGVLAKAEPALQSQELEESEGRGGGWHPHQVGQGWDGCSEGLALTVGLPRARRTLTCRLEVQGDTDAETVSWCSAWGRRAMRWVVSTTWGPEWSGPSQVLRAKGPEWWVNWARKGIQAEEQRQ